MDKVTFKISILIWVALGFQPLSAQDEKLAVEDPNQPALSAIPTLWIVGGSDAETVDQARDWTEDLEAFFDLQKINIKNETDGLPLQEFFSVGKWKKIEASLKPGDFVLACFQKTYIQPEDPPVAREEKPTIRRVTSQKPMQLSKPDPDAKAMKLHQELIQKLAEGAQTRKGKVILCTTAPTLRAYPSPTQDDPGSKWLFTPMPLSWRKLLENCAKSERTAFVDIANILSNAYKEMEPKTLRTLSVTLNPESPNIKITNSDGSMFNARLIVSGLRSIPTNPLDGFLNEAGRETRPLLNNIALHTFHPTNGPTINGVLVSAEGNSAVVMEMPTRRNVTLLLTDLIEAERKLVEEWKQKNPVIKLSYQVTKSSHQPLGKSQKDELNYYTVQITNLSKDPTPRLAMCYRYKIDVRNTGPSSITKRQSLDFKNLEIPSIPASGTITVETPQILLADERKDVVTRENPGTKKQFDRYSTYVWKESLNGIAFDILGGSKVLHQYRTNGFMKDEAVHSSGLSYSE